MLVQVSAQQRLAWTPNLRRHRNDVILPAGLLLDVTAFTTSKIKLVFGKTGSSEISILCH